ncbi:MAG: hypothetical protein P8103_09085 [Candidatus Thiodiazotropha sp.]
MDTDFEKLIRVNIQGRVFVTCQTRGVTDPAIIGYYVDILEQSVSALLTKDSTPADFQAVLEEQLKWLEGELDQVRSEARAQPGADKDLSESEQGAEQERHTTAGDKHETGYVPEAKAMPERLKDRRAIMEHLLDNDCITLKLITPEEAQKYKHGLLGKQPENAEEEVVTALRTVLHEQIRKFIRKHNGGPWANANKQHELRMDITRTKTLCSLVTLAKELLSERDEWLQKTKGSLTGRFFGGKVKMNK